MLATVLVYHVVGMCPTPEQLLFTGIILLFIRALLVNHYYPVRMRSRARVFGVSVCQFVCLFVCLFVHHFLACSGVLDLFKVSFSTVKIVLVNTLAFLCLAFESDHAEAQKKPVFPSLGC